jgi:hypothetical protein
VSHAYPRSQRAAAADSALSRLSGYVYELPPISGPNKMAAADVKAKINNDLNSDDFPWIDAATRAVFVEFTLFNPNENHFMVVSVVVEFPTGGGSIASWDMWISRLRRYITSEDRVMPALELVVLIGALLHFRSELIQVPPRCASVAKLCAADHRATRSCTASGAGSTSRRPTILPMCPLSLSLFRSLRCAWPSSSTPSRTSSTRTDSRTLSSSAVCSTRRCASACARCMPAHDSRANGAEHPLLRAGAHRLVQDV